jgi:hypothetical protein
MFLVSRSFSFGSMNHAVAVFGRRIESVEFQLLGVRLVHDVVSSPGRNDDGAPVGNLTLYAVENRDSATGLDSYELIQVMSLLPRCPLSAEGSSKPTGTANEV